MKSIIFFKKDFNTEKSIKSFFVGNALCAHAALVELQIPWLADFNKAESNVEKNPLTKKRPDFLGQDKRSRWFVFESKGRSRRPGPADFKEWKQQARSVKRVGGQEVQHGVVSSGFLNSDGEWELVWADPPAEDAEDAVVDDFGFFAAYYNPIVEYIAAPGEVIETEYGLLKLDRNRAVYIGLHRTILTAVRHKFSPPILNFASSIPSFEFDGEDQCSLYADGMIVKLGPNWESSPQFQIKHLLTQKQETVKQNPLVRASHSQVKKPQQQIMQQRLTRY